MTPPRPSAAAGRKKWWAWRQKLPRESPGRWFGWTSYAAGVAAFGEDSGGASMAALLRLLYLNGAASVAAVAVGGTGTKEEYTAAFGLLAEAENIA